MKKIFTSLLVVLAFCTVIIAAVQTELRMHVFSNGDNGQNIVKALADVDSVKFTYDTLEYKVTFMDWDGTVLQSGILLAGETPKYEGEKNPTREQTAKYTYNFKGWTPEIEEVQDEATYTADYDSTIRKYIVLFMAQNGDILLTDYLDYGAMPNYTGELPTKENTKLYDYTLVWKPAIAEVTGNVTFKADFDSTKHKYTCIFNDYDGTELVKMLSTYDSVNVEEPIHSSSETYKYDFNSWSLDTSKIARDTLIYTAVYDSIVHGTLGNASFKVSDTKSVYFSQGNLQFNPQGSHKTADSTANGTWRFAERQYDYLGSSNDYDGNSNSWDLFGFGTSGWNSGASYYQPRSYDYKSKYYIDDDLTGTYANADWGVYNAISNGGNILNKWRTLTKSEWNYLFNNNKWTLGYIKDSTNSYLCLLLIPEKFTAPEGTTVTVLSTTTSSTTVSVPSTNMYTTEQFASLEKLGVVALPCGGNRHNYSYTSVDTGTITRHKVEGVGTYGFYWSSTFGYINQQPNDNNNNKYAYRFRFSKEGWNLNDGLTLSAGCSVRLVQDVQ